MTGNPHENNEGMSDTPERKKQTRFGVTFIEILVSLFVTVILIVLTLPMRSQGWKSARLRACENNLEQIGIALQNYAEEYGAYPPAYTVDAEGKPLHSWRTLILPYLDQQDVYEKIDLSKPWNDPANLDAYKTEVRTYRCPSTELPPTHTTYLAVVSTNSFFRLTEPRLLSEVTDNHGETLMVFDVTSERAVHWMAPQDVDERIILDFGSDREHNHRGTTNALCVDGSVAVLYTNEKLDELRAMISIAGHETVKGLNKSSR